MTRYGICVLVWCLLIAIVLTLTILVAERSFSGMASVIKNPPVLHDLEHYEQWKEDILMWTELTDIDKKKQALAIHLTLTGQAKEVANQVLTEDKKKENGVKILLDKLDEAFMKEPERRKFMAYQSFEECVRKDNMSICEFMREFDMKYYKMKEKGMELPDEVLAFRLVKNCELSDVQREQVMASTKPLSFKEVRATLKRMFESSSGNTSNEGQDVKVKVEPVYMSSATSKDVLKGRKAVVEQELKNINSQIEGSDLAEEDVLWTTNYGYNKYWNNGRYPRGGRYGRYRRRNNFDRGCFECGSKEHWVRNCDKVKGNDKKEL